MWTCLTFCYDECLPYMDITQHMWSPMWQVGSSPSAKIRWNNQLWQPDRHQKNQCTMKQASLTKCQPHSWQKHWVHIQQATLSLNLHISRWHILLPNSQTWQNGGRSIASTSTVYTTEDLTLVPSNHYRYTWFDGFSCCSLWGRGQNGTFHPVCDIKE